MTEAERIAAKLTKAQRDMLTRPPGIYDDRLWDIGALLNLGLIRTEATPLGLAVREALK